MDVDRVELKTKAGVPTGGVRYEVRWRAKGRQHAKRFKTEQEARDFAAAVDGAPLIDRDSAGETLQVVSGGVTVEVANLLAARAAAQGIPVSRVIAQILAETVARNPFADRSDDYQKGYEAGLADADPGADPVTTARAVRPRVARPDTDSNLAIRQMKDEIREMKAAGLRKRVAERELAAAEFKALATPATS